MKTKGEEGGAAIRIQEMSTLPTNGGYVRQDSFKPEPDLERKVSRKKKTEESDSNSNVDSSYNPRSRKPNPNMEKKVTRRFGIKEVEKSQ